MPLTKLLKKDVPFTWTEDQEKAFQTLKHALVNAPVLAFPDYSKPFLLCTDASGIGLGAVLMQSDDDGKKRVIAYASRLLNSAEKNYSVTHWEALAVVWALKHFRDILYGYQVHVQTDHLPLCDLFKGRNLAGRLARWSVIINDYNPTFQYVPGKLNVVADALSRHVAAVSHMNEYSWMFDYEILHYYQRIDPVWSRVIYYLESGDQSSLPKLPVPISEFYLANEILHRKTFLSGTDMPNREVKQLVVPTDLIQPALHNIHNTPHAAHPGKDRSLRQARLYYYWPTMRKDILAHCDACVSCALHKGSTGDQAPILQYPVPVQPWHTVSLDLLKLPRTNSGCNYLLVVVDHFSRFVVLVPLQEKSATSVARAFISNVICPFTTPEVILTDNGSEFNNSVLEEICRQYNITKCNVVARHPASNGLVERQNRKVLECLRHMISDTSRCWDDWIPMVAASINCSINKSIGETPFFVIYGMDKRLPYSLLQSEPAPLYNHDDYVKVQVSNFQKIHKYVQDNLAHSKAEMLSSQHAKASDVNIEVGDLVFAFNHDRSSKLESKFLGPFRVLARKGNKFEIKSLSSGEMKWVHADDLKRAPRGIQGAEPSLTQATTNLHDSPSPATHDSHSTQPSPVSQDFQPSNPPVNDYRSKLRSAHRSL